MVDTGEGIKAEDSLHLCQMFGKLYRTAEMNHEGIGLGLTVSKALVEANGGSIQIASDGIDKGSVFAFTMQMTKIRAKSSSIKETKPSQLLSLDESSTLL